MSEPIDIRILGPLDVTLMRALNGVFATAFADAPTYLGQPPGDAYLADLLSRPHIIAIAVLVEGQVVGGLVAYQLDKLEQDRREIYIYDLAVDEPFRRRGLARAAIAMLQSEAHRRGAYVIFVQADLEDAPAIALYDSLGVRETAHHFDIPPRRSPDG